MRRRSETVNADSYEEFYELSTSQSPDLFFSHPLGLIESPYCFLDPHNNNLHEAYISMDYPEETLAGCFRKPLNPLSDNIDTAYNEGVTPSTDTGSGSLEARTDSFYSCGENSLIKLCNAGQDNKVKINGDEGNNGGLHKVMIIGSMGTGRHAMIDALFGGQIEEKSGEPKLRNGLDLLIKSKIRDGITQRFKFWIRDPNYQRFDPLIKMYYKSIDYYVFIYKSTDIKSLESTEKAIQEVVNEVQRGKFRGLLIGTWNNRSEEKKVNIEEAEKIRGKYGLERCVEIGNFVEEVKDLEREFLEFLKCDLK